jgi:hypothetical protein
MRTRCFARSVLVMLIVGTLTAAQQASAGSVFSAAAAASESLPAAPPFALGDRGAPPGPPLALASTPVPGDTVETFDVQVEEEKGPGLWKQLIVFGIITGAVAYAVVTLLKSDDEGTTTTGSGGSGKPTPSRGASLSIALPLSR